MASHSSQSINIDVPIEKRNECLEQSRETTYLYIITNIYDKLYVGISNNPTRRLKEHNTKNGASFTHDGSYKIVYLEKYDNYVDARRREIQVKKWSRKKKLWLINGGNAISLNPQ